MSEVLRLATEVVNAEIENLSFTETCLVIHMLDELSERALQMVEKRMPEAEIKKVAEEIDFWVRFGNGSTRSWETFGTGKDEEQAIEEDLMWKQHERDERMRRHNRQSHSNDLDDNYEL